MQTADILFHAQNMRETKHCCEPRDTKKMMIINNVQICLQRKKRERKKVSERKAKGESDSPRTRAHQFTMAGLGRRSHYRKHLTDSVLNDLPEPDAEYGERIAKVIGTRGGNMFEVLVANPVIPAGHEETEGSQSEEQSPSNNEEPQKVPSNSDRTIQLAILPTKFHKLVWVKRNDYVIVQAGAQDDDQDRDGEDGRGIRHIISHILYKEQVKHLKSKNLWPEDDEEFTATNDTTDPVVDDNVRARAMALTEKEKEAQKGNNNANLEYDEEYDDESDEEEDGIVYNSVDNDDYYVNTNRIAAMTIQDSSSESDSD